MRLEGKNLEFELQMLRYTFCPLCGRKVCPVGLACIKICLLRKKLHELAIIRQLYLGFPVPMKIFSDGRFEHQPWEYKLSGEEIEMQNYLDRKLDEYCYGAAQ